MHDSTIRRIIRIAFLIIALFVGYCMGRRDRSASCCITSPTKPASAPILVPVPGGHVSNNLSI